MGAAERIGAPANKIRISQLSVFNRPPKDSVMAVIKGYLDDSQTNGKFWAIGGYVGGQLNWEEFDLMWPLALATHDVPYFHMREMQDPNGVYAKWYPANEHEEELAAFFGDLAKVIYRSGLIPFCCLVRIEDLQRFNSENNLNLQAYPLAAYGSMILVGKRYTGYPVELIFDHVEQVDSKLVQARKYADSDSYYGPDGIFDKLVTVPLSKAITWRKVLALQAADFWVWEYRKNHSRMDEWWSLEDRPQEWGDEQWEHMTQWMQQKYGGFEQGTRKSAQALLRNNKLTSMIWHYKELSNAHALRRGVWAK